MPISLDKVKSCTTSSRPDRRNSGTLFVSLIAALMICPGTGSAQIPALSQMPTPDGSEPPVKFAIYSAAWSQNSNAGLRVVAQNQTGAAIELVSIVFADENEPERQEELQLHLQVPPNGWAELQLPYQNLIFGNDCVAKTAQEDWQLVEISNYTLNPSVRGLIIEDTSSFRIYQCVRPVYSTWMENGEILSQSEWVLYHYERRPQNN